MAASGAPTQSPQLRPPGQARCSGQGAARESDRPASAPSAKLLVLHPALVSLDAHICLIAEAQRKPRRGPRGASADGDCPPLPCPDGPCRGLPVSLSLGLTTLQNRRRYCLISPGRKERLSLVRALAQGYITVGEEPGLTESETDPSPASSRAPHPGLFVCVGTRFLKSLRAPTSS